VCRSVYRQGDHGSMTLNAFYGLGEQGMEGWFSM